MPQRRKKKQEGARRAEPKPRGAHGASERREAANREIDEMARRGGKSKWQEASEPAAGDPQSPEELAGVDLLGRASVRGGAISGVSEASAESGVDRPDTTEPRGARRNPPLEEDVDEIDAGSTGGSAGGERGHGGSSSGGAGTAEGYQKAGPGEDKSTSRFDLDRGTLDVPE